MMEPGKDHSPLPRLLCVDDEANVLAALQRNLFEDFDVETATSGAEALEIIDEEEEPFAVVMSDMRMPEMDGAELLSRVRKASPDSVRLLLTGQAEISAAMRAINDGGIFRFLLKPCAQPDLMRALNDAVAHHGLVMAERVLLQQTLMQSLEVLTQVLGLAAPLAFERSQQLRALVAHAAKALKLEGAWRYEAAAMLSQLGCVTVPSETIERALAGQPLGSKDKTILASHPAVASELLARIPRLEMVAEMIRAQGDPGLTEDPDAVRGATLIRIALVLDAAVRRGESRSQALAALAKDRVADPDLLRAFSGFRSETIGDVVRGVRVEELRPMMILEEDVVGLNGATLTRAGLELNRVIIARLCNFAKGVGVKEPVRVRIPVGPI